MLTGLKVLSLNIKLQFFVIFWYGPLNKTESSYHGNKN